MVVHVFVEMKNIKRHNCHVDIDSFFLTYLEDTPVTMTRTTLGHSRPSAVNATHREALRALLPVASSFLDL